jgi:L-ascorbate metabolism protein UlaG (beta-lactamase superfamily)
MSGDSAMMIARLAACALLLSLAAPASAQDGPVPSQCLAIAETLPQVTYASLTPVQAEAEEVTITYAGHSTYVIETPGGVRIATDYSGHYGFDPLPHVITMNKAHSTHYTLNPDPRIEHVLPGWDDDDPPAAHAIVVEDVYIRNVPTDIRTWGGGTEIGGNSIFIFEVAGLCIGHLGHLHHPLEPEHYGAIGRLDIVMVPIDGGMTLSLPAMSEITSRLQSSIVLPMHRFSTPIPQFVSMLDEAFTVEFRDSRTLKVSLRSLPRRPTVVILEGV